MKVAVENIPLQSRGNQKMADLSKSEKPSSLESVMQEPQLNQKKEQLSEASSFNVQKIGNETVITIFNNQGDEIIKIPSEASIAYKASSEAASNLKIQEEI